MTEQTKKHSFSILTGSTGASPAFSEADSKKGWVKYGDDDGYAEYLQSLFVGSSIHSAVVKGVGDMIFGGGLKARETGHAQMVKVVELFSGDVLKRAALDLKLYGQCYLNPIWSVDRTTIAEVHHLPVAHMRCGLAGDEDRITEYYYSALWTAQSVPKVMPAFSHEDRVAASTVVHIKLYSPVGFYYGIPDYVGSTSYIDVDIEVGDFHLSNIQNGLFPSMMINFNNGVPSEEERRMLEQEINRKFQGAQSAGKTLISWNDSAEEAPSFEAFQPSEPQRVYQFLSKEVVTKILSGHRVTSPLIFGVRGEGGGFGSNADEMRDAYELFSNSVIQSFQDTLLDGLRPILQASGVSIPLYFEKLAPAEFLWSDGIGGKDTGNKDASYNGAQITAATDVLAQVAQGIITEEQAKVFLIQMLQFEPDVAEALFVEGASAVDQMTDKVQMSGRISDIQSNAWMVHLASKNSQPPARWRLWKEERVVDSSQERKLHRNRRDFAESMGALEGYGNYQMPSEWGDVVSPQGHHFALRYQYEPLDSTAVSKTGKSREFCQNMVSISESGVMYRFEDITDMSFDGVNGQFAAAGSSNYDIFEFKGGVNCYHTWLRKIYILDDPTLSEADIEAEWDEVMTKVGDNPYVPPKGEESIAPIDMPKGASLK